MRTDPEPVLHLIETAGPGGAETVLASIVAALSRDRWRSRVLVPHEGWLLDRLTALRADVRVVSSERRVDIRFLRALVSEIRSFRPRVVHAHLLGAGVYGAMATRLTGGPGLVCTIHGLPDVDPSDRLLWVKARLIGRARNRVVYVSHDLRARLEPLLGIPSSLGRVIHNGVEFLSDAPVGDEWERMGVPRGHRVVGAVGNIRPPKDYATLLRAARIVCDQRDDVSFVIVGGGGGTLADELKALGAQLGLEDHVRFLGFRADASELMRAFDLFVSSSSSEGLPLATLEAVGMGKPVVLTRCGGPSEIVEHGRTGLLVETGDPAGLARSVLRLLSAPDEAQALGARGREDVRRRFSLAAMVAAYETLYHQAGLTT